MTLGLIASAVFAVISVGDFEYAVGDNVDSGHPHGDLDRIVIDGMTMPKRGSASASIRGEDIAVLIESYATRGMCLATYRATAAYNIMTFSTDIRKSTVNGLIDFYNSMMTNVPYLFVYPGETIGGGSVVHDIPNDPQSIFGHDSVSRAFPSKFWSYQGRTKFPIGRIESGAISNAEIYDLFFGISRYFRTGVTSYYKKSYESEADMSFSDDFHGITIDHSRFTGIGIISGYECVGRRDGVEASWKWGATTFSGGGKVTINVLDKLFDLAKSAKHIKRAWPVYFVRFESENADAGRGVSCFISNYPVSPSPDGTVNLEIGRDVMENRFWSAYGRPQKKTPPEIHDDTPLLFACSFRIIVESIYFFFEFDDDVS